MKSKEYFLKEEWKPKYIRACNFSKFKIEKLAQREIEPYIYKRIKITEIN